MWIEISFTRITRVQSCQKLMEEQIWVNNYVPSMCNFFITDQVEKGNFEIQYCSTDQMTEDFQTKALQGTKFCEF